MVQPESQWIGAHAETADSLAFVGMTSGSMLTQAAREGVKMLRVVAGDLSTEHQDSAAGLGVDVVHVPDGVITLERRRGKGRLNVIVNDGVVTKAAFF